MKPESNGLTKKQFLGICKKHHGKGNSKLEFLHQRKLLSWPFASGEKDEKMTISNINTTISSISMTNNGHTMYLTWSTN